MDQGDWENAVDPDMQAAMGFASFGGQPNKKRKYNHNDAVVSIDNPISSISGSNTTELGMRKPRPSYGSVQPPQGTPGDAKPGEYAIRHPEGASAGLSQFIAQAQTLPPRQYTSPSGTDPFGATSASGPIAGRSKSFPTGVPKQFFDQLTWKELEAYRKGVKDENGDIAYFLPSFVEDPWAKLEREQAAAAAAGKSM
ncbi:hypothetical protein EJ08DRAFT_233058 [Tothia fuscella]|uniref:Uncharacterized protein n=1 Tax=Tothia fuscella TaxID=1048955 RepID=A0A9P4P2N8_9PEZI|nr:hypothetical protein EJ08DRAFT_233058 [Tothia fuscella]